MIFSLCAVTALMSIITHAPLNYQWLAELDVNGEQRNLTENLSWLKLVSIQHWWKGFLPCASCFVSGTLASRFSKHATDVYQRVFSFGSFLVRKGILIYGY
jgi:hypothetical protein